ncbi:ThuA domain-containing protein [Nibricoccus sp. IMCC34717]|uniref:ThuA domain-containing protein n=1 Tax=Nibricoccus sp. IMCC34717 TaxID=3034021 RepID=UPI00384BEAC6
MKTLSLSQTLSALCATAILTPVLAAEEAPNRAIPAADPAKVALVDAALPKQATVKPAKPRKILLCARTEGFYHESIPVGLYALRTMGERTGAYTVEIDNEMSAFTPENLARFDGILFLNTSQLKFENPARRQALLDFVRRDGKALMGIHAASDNFPTWPEGQGLMGGVFHSHPWVWNSHNAVKVDDPEHPVVAAFGQRGFWITDEIYQIVGPYSREKQRVLLSLDMSKAQNLRPADQIVRTDNDFPICWVKQEGAGRVFYSSLGHNDHIYWDAKVLRHYLDGIQFALGDLAADVLPKKDYYSALAPQATLTSTENLLPALLANEGQSENTALRSLEASLRAATATERAALLGTLSEAAAKQSVHDTGRTMLAQVFGAYGSDAQVPLLATWAAEGNDEAVRALARLSSEAAVKALTAALDSKAAQKIAILSALELTHSPLAVDALSAVLKSGTPEEVIAARDALARINSPAALRALQSAGQSAGDKDLAWAILTSAWTADAANLNDRLKAVKGVLASPKDLTVYVAAANTLVQLGGDQGLLDTLALFSDVNAGPRLSTAWVMKASASNATAAIEALSKTLPSLPAPVQFAVVSLAEQQGKENVLPLIRPLLTAKDDELRRAAIVAWGACAHDIKHTEVLLPILAQANDRPAAITAFSRLRADGLDALVRKNATAEKNPALLAAWLTIASNRVDNEIMPQVLKLLSADNAEVRQAAFRALKPLVRGEDLDLLLGLRAQLKTSAERRAWQDATVTAIAFRNDIPAVVSLLQRELPNANTSERTTFVIALANMKTPDAIATIRSELDSPQIERRKEVIRALSTVRQFVPVQLLLDAATKATDSNERILALRGAIDTLFTLAELGNDDKLTSYKRVWALAERKEEKDAMIKLTDWLWHAEGRQWADSIKASYNGK